MSEISNNNMGVITKQEIIAFVSIVFKELQLKNWTLDWEENGAVCIKDRKRIVIDSNLINKYPWQAKEMVLHEVTHIYTDDKFHSIEFYKEYIRLLKKFMIGENRCQRI